MCSHTNACISAIPPTFFNIIHNKVQKDVEHASKIWLQNGTKNNNTTSKHASRSLQCIKFVAEAFRSEEKVCQRTGSSVNYFVPTLDPPLGRSVPKTTILVGDQSALHPYQISSNSIRDSGEEVENKKNFTLAGRLTTMSGLQTEGLMDVGQRLMRIAMLSLSLRWA